MKAAVWYEKGDIRIEDIPDPKPRTKQVKVRINTCAICGLDLHEYREGPFIISTRPAQSSEHLRLIDSLNILKAN